tara:strand:- start:24931 stop:25320 length:390 start_codon:yes stop_codon:yes gene_type:complete
MARGGAKKLHHATIRDAAESVLIDIDAIKYETFKEQVVNCYNELAHQNGYYSKSGAIQNNDWQTLWRRCSSTALLYLREQTDWVKIKHRVLTDVIYEGKRLHTEEYELIRRFLIPHRNISAKQKRKLSQ